MRAVLAVAAATLLFAGCANVPDVRVPAFDVLGRMLASHDGQAFSAHFRWRRNEADSEIWLMSPAGTTLAHIKADSAGATLSAADGRQYRAFSAEGLTRSALGWTLPLVPLQYWIRAEPAPGSVPDEQTRDFRGRLLLLAQAGWRIRYAYNEAAESGGMLPQRLDLEQGGQRLRLVIDDWREQAGALP
jgi:outer membrane lipoprotein LolB